jgi:hypothetical protein
MRALPCPALPRPALAGLQKLELLPFEIERANLAMGPASAETEAPLKG